MNLRNFRIGWRTLVKEPAYSLVVVLGMAVGTAACLLLLGFVRYSWQYNAFVPDVDNVYIVKARNNADPMPSWSEHSPVLLRPVAEHTAGVAAVTAFLNLRPQGRKIALRIGDRFHPLRSLIVAPGFSDMLGLRAIEGDLEAALERPENFAVTEEAATQAFGTSHAIGRTVIVEGQTMRVAAVLRNPAANTTIPFEMLVGVNSLLGFEDLRNEMMNSKMGWVSKVLIRVKPGTSLDAITQTFQQAVDHAPVYQIEDSAVKARLGGRKTVDIKLAPLRQAYFDGEIQDNYHDSRGPRASPLVMAALAVVAVLIAALATINYVNLSTVRVLRRQREIGMRKVLGASERQIALQFLAESLLVALLATGLGLLLAWITLPVFAELVNRKLDGIFSAQNLIAAVVSGVALGVVSAAYPAWIAIGIRPMKVLAGRPDMESIRGRNVRRVMTVAQISVAMALAGIALAVAWQTRFALRVPVGFDPSPLLIVDLPDTQFRGGAAHGLMESLRHQDEIDGVSISTEAVGKLGQPWHSVLRREGGSDVSVEMKSVGVDFFDTYHLKPLAGRLFNPHVDKENDRSSIVIDRMAVGVLGFASPEAAVGQYVILPPLNGKSENGRIIGVAPDLRFRSIREAPRPLVYEAWNGGNVLSIRAKASISDAERAVQAVWPTFFPDTMLVTTKAKDILAENYEEDARLARLLFMATAIALAIAAFGSYVLAAYTVQRRAKEIVLRKLYGAGRRDAGRLMVREIGGLTLIAAAIGLPIAAVAIERYLAGYVEHAPIGYWTLAFALGATLIVVLAAAARHARIAMNMAPADALRL